MNEFALMHRGRVTNIVTTTKTESELQESHPTYEVVRLDAVRQSKLDDYRYWNERP